MKILFIGGTRFIGPFAVRQLCELGHQVTVFHRGKTCSELLPDVQHITSGGNPADPANRRRLKEFTDDFHAISPDVVVDMIAFSREDAVELVETFKSRNCRLVVLSSEDIYRAFGRVHGTEPGLPDPTPLQEESPLREKPSIHGQQHDKRHVEETVMSHPTLAATILRLPAVYGPGDHRLYEFTRRMFDQRPAILFDERLARWRWTHGYVEDVAHAITLAVTHDRAAGRIYNVGELNHITIQDRIASLARAASWNGQIIPLPSEQLPTHLIRSIDTRQDWTINTNRIRNELGYREIIPEDQGYKQMIEW